MPAPPERAAAERLARVLDGVERGSGEVLELARTLERAAQTARIEVTPLELEEALGRLPRRARKRSGRRAITLGVALAALAAALLVALPLSRSPAVDVPARAAAAVAARGRVLEIVERVRPGAGGLLPASTRTGYVDPGTGTVRWTLSSGNRILEESLLTPRRVVRYLPQRRSAVVAPSCAALASACAQLVDPIAFYRQALARTAAPTVEPTSVDGRSAYLLRLPAQTLPGAVRVEQLAWLDAKTFLPFRLEWREQLPGGRQRTAAVVDVVRLARVARGQLPAGALALSLPAQTRVTRILESGKPVRRLGARPLSLAAARRLHPPALWLGRRALGRPLDSVTLVRWSAGTALRLQYGPLTVWNYGPVVPEALRAGRLSPIKESPLGSTVVRFYATTSGALALERERPGGTVALVAPELLKERLFGLVGRLRPLR